MELKRGLTYRVYAGNYKTGVFVSREVKCKGNGVNIEDAVSECLDEVGWDFGVWATYSAAYSEEATTEDFKKYMAWRAA